MKKLILKIFTNIYKYSIVFIRSLLFSLLTILHIIFFLGTGFIIIKIISFIKKFYIYAEYLV